MFQQRLQLIRTWMREQGIDAFVVPTVDPHNSEYVPEHWQCRVWATGFTGSAGTAVVTHDDARLWTDSRYWLQATEQLAGTGYSLMKEDVDASPEEWLAAQGLTLTYYDPRQLPDVFDAWWNDRPALPLSQAEVMSDADAGEKAADKLRRIVTWLAENGKEEVLIEELSELCWTLNIRGNDIPYNPFVIAFLAVRSTGHHTLYIDARQITPEVAAYLQQLSVEVAPYEDGLRHPLAGNKTPVAAWRTIKNASEQEGFRSAHLRDGIAMVQFLRRLDVFVADEEAYLTEIGVDEMLTHLRAQQPGFRGLSFETIAAYGPHGAIVHYEATPETDVPLGHRSFLLLDSGAHYSSADGTHGVGTTDITRTIALGPLTEEEKRVYTLVLKGHLQLQNLRFPQGTCGLQLDTMARMAMWREGYDYGHGTGHGVGHRLGVHEGPAQIRKNVRPGCTTIPFSVGQTVTDEPGIYVAGKFGVRIENTLLVQDDGTTEFGEWQRFEPLTLCPYDLRPVIVDMLTPEERTWLNDYHRRVCDTLMPHLTDEADRQWLTQATKAI